MVATVKLNESTILISLRRVLILLIITTLIFSCGPKKTLPIARYYDYDQKLPLNDSVNLVDEKPNYLLYHVTYKSVHNKTVTALLSVPKNAENPLPVIILLHGLGDRKTVDYIEAGNQYLIDSGYAVFRIDIANHGERMENDYDFSLTGKYRYWTRDIVSQTVFDLRRAVDFLSQRREIDPKRIGFFGISLGGIIGVDFCGVDDRVKVPVIALAGGNLNLMFGIDALSEDVKDYLSIIDPINFVTMIYPRPLLMINASNDEIVPPITSKLLYNKAKDPKDIIWYPTKHRAPPIDKAYPEGIHWFNQYLR